MWTAGALACVFGFCFPDDARFPDFPISADSWVSITRFPDDQISRSPPGTLLPAGMMGI
jgi:hypothetical protein